MIRETNFNLPYHTRLYRGKVRDVYTVEEHFMVFVASDRISAFDVILPQLIPHKGQVLNQTAAHFLQATRDIVRNHLVAVPDPNVSIGVRCDAYPVEVIVRGHLCGSAWRAYKAGARELCGAPLPNGLNENDALPEPILTPTTKSTVGHDIEITENEIIKSGLVPPDEWAIIRQTALRLFERGQAMAAERGLILADTKYEFGYKDFDILLIDEIHTPDSSRYFYADGFAERQARGERQKQLSKEFVREWLMAQGFSGQDGQQPPVMTDDVVQEISHRYIEVYETVTGLGFQPRPAGQDASQAAEQATVAALRQLGL